MGHNATDELPLPNDYGNSLSGMLATCDTVSQHTVGREEHLASLEFTGERQGTHDCQQPCGPLLVGTFRRAHERFAVAGYFFQVVAGFFVGEAFPQLIIDAGRLEAVDLIDCSGAISRKGAEDVARAGIVGGNHTVLARHIVIHGFQLLKHQHIQVGGSQLDVVGRIEEVLS